jgi:hypothetical protein
LIGFRVFDIIGLRFTANLSDSLHWCGLQSLG